MRRTAISRVGALAVVLAVVLCALMSGEAAAGEFRVASCQADRLNFSTQAFSDFATRGMKIKRACNPEGPGLRGLITANVVERGTGRARRAGAGHDQRPGGHPLHQLPLGGHGPSARLPLRASALRRRARRPADRAQERAREPTLPAPTAGPGRRLPITHLQHQRRHARRSARHLRGRQRTQVVLGARLQLHPHLQGRGRDRRHARSHRRDHRRQRTGPRRVGARDPAAQLRRQRQRRRAHGPSGRLRADRRHATAPVRVGVSRRRLRQRRPVPERPRAHRRRHDELPRGNAAACRAGPGHRRQHRDLGRGDGPDRQQSARPGRGRRGGRPGMAEQQQLRRHVGEPAGERSRTDRGGRLQAVRRWRRTLQSGRADRSRHRAPRGSGSVAGRVDLVAVAT